MMFNIYAIVIMGLLYIWLVMVIYEDSFCDVICCFGMRTVSVMLRVDLVSSLPLKAVSQCSLPHKLFFFLFPSQPFSSQQNNLATNKQMTAPQWEKTRMGENMAALQHEGPMYVYVHYRSAQQVAVNCLRS